MDADVKRTHMSFETWVYKNVSSMECLVKGGHLVCSTSLAGL